MNRIPRHRSARPRRARRQPLNRPSHRPAESPPARLEPLEERQLMSTVPFGADYRDNSEFMLGDVMVTVVLVESDGSIDANQEDWTSSEIETVKGEIMDGAQWWKDTLATQFPDSPHTLDFQFDFTFADNPLETGYEPINHDYSVQSLYIDDFLDATGHNTSGSIFTDLDRWNHDQRVAHDTDWAFTVFVIDSTVDSNGKFTDGSAAFAYFGGPFMVMTTDNGGWGLDRMDRIFAHEMGHIFYALDEYPGSESYTEFSGYYNIQNTNAADGHPDSSSRTASIMAEAGKLTDAWNNHTSSTASFEMIGWRDSDGDGVFDVLDVPLSLSGDGSFDSASRSYSFSGSSTVGTLDNQNPYGTGHDITLNSVDTLEYRINGGQWVAAGSYGQYSVNLDVDIDLSHLAGGSHTIELRTLVDQTSVASNVFSDSFVIDTGAGVNVVPISGLVTSEAGSAASFEVTLNSRPTADVIIGIASSDTTEGVTNVTELVFTAENWNVAQTVTITGVDDLLNDGDVSYTIQIADAVSADAAYHGLTTPNVQVTNVNDDFAGVTVTPTSGLKTDESGGTATFDVVLNSRPTSDVTISIASSDLTEGATDVTTLVFTADNWNVAQAVTVTGVDDTTRDGNVSYTIVTGATQSADAAYHGLDVDDVAVQNTDNDRGGGKKSRDNDSDSGGTDGGGTGTGGTDSGGTKPGKGNGRNKNAPESGASSPTIEEDAFATFMALAAHEVSGQRQTGPLTAGHPASKRLSAVEAFLTFE